VYVSDPKALHHIIVKDQYIYEETEMFLTSNKLIFGDGLLSTLGDQHKRQRKLLNPVFSIANLRNIAPILYRITHKLRDSLTEKLSQGPQEIDMLYWVSRAALEYIGQAGLGYSFDNLEESDDNEYSRAAKGLLPSLISMAVYRQFLPFITKLAPRPLLGFMIDLLPFAAVKNLKRISLIIHKTSTEVFKSKKIALAEGDKAIALQVGEGKDIMSVLLKANASAEEKDRLPEEELLGQMNTLIFAAHDTTSSALSRILQVLALHPDEQAKLRAEVTEARAEAGDLPYDSLEALPFLDAVVRETLRVYAPITFFSRTTRKDIVLPLGSPVVSTTGKVITELHLKNNTNVVLGLGVANRDVSIWGEDADEWKPERWIGRSPDEVSKERLPGVYSGMMTFLGGGRACIGFKFSLLEMKVVLSILLENFSFEVGKQEILWENNSVMGPMVGHVPSLPLRVSLVKPPGN
jgi:cytochrome P450